MKKFLAFLLSFMMLFSSISLIVNALSGVFPGDINGDSNVTAADARLALRFSANLETPSEKQKNSADVNRDGKITASDARQILRVSAGLDEFEVEDEDEVLQLNPDEEQLKDGLNEYFDIKNDIEDIKYSYENENGFIPEDQVDDIVSDISDYAQDLMNEKEIKSYNTDTANNTVYIETSEGIGFLFVPKVEGVDSVISTYQPCLNTYSLDTQSFGIQCVDGAAEAIANTVDGYTFSNNHDTDDVTLEKIKSIGENQVVIWHGHGAYNSSIHSALLTDISLDEEKFLWDPVYYIKNINYTSDYLSGRIVCTDEGKICVTSKFFDKYLGSLNNSFVYLGTCSSGADDVLPNTFISKGAKAVVANTGVIHTIYNLNMINDICENMTLVSDDSQKYYTLNESSGIAKQQNGSVCCATHSQTEVKIWGDEDYRYSNVGFEKKSGTLTGTITDSETKAPIYGVTVEAVDNNSDGFDVVASSVSDINGQYSLTLPYGDYSLSFTHDSYEYYGTSVNINFESYEEDVILSSVKAGNNDEEGNTQEIRDVEPLSKNEMSVEQITVEKINGYIAEERQFVDYSFTATETGVYRFEFSDLANNLSFRMTVFNSDMEKLYSDYSLHNGKGLTVNLKAGNTYYIRVEQYSGVGSFTLNIGSQTKTVDTASYNVISDRIVFTDQVNNYKFVPSISGSYRFEFSDVTNNASFRLSVRNSYGEQLDSDYSLRSGGGITIRLDADETYYFSVSQYSSVGSYKINIGEQKKQINISKNNVINDSIQYTDQQNVYLFKSDNEGIYRFEFSDITNSASLRMSIYNEHFELLSSDYSLKNSSGLTMNFAENTKYYIVVQFYSRSGSYSLNIGRPGKTVDFTSESVSGRITYTDENDCFSFKPGSSGQYRFFFSDITNNASFRMSVYNENHEFISSDYSLRNDQGLTVSMDSGKTYYICIQYYSGTGEYRLNQIRTGDAQPPFDNYEHYSKETVTRINKKTDTSERLTESVLFVDRTEIYKQYDRITLEGEYKDYYFTPVVTGVHRIEFGEVTNGASFRMYVYDNAENELKHDYSMSNGNGFTLELTAGNTYKIRVQQYSNYGSYVLGIGSQKPTVNISDKNVIKDSVQYTDQKNNYMFTPELSGTYRFEFSGVTNNASLRMYVFNSEWEQLAHDYSLRSGGGLTLQLEGGKTYYVSVRQYSSIGVYSLKVGCQKPLIEIGDNNKIYDSIQFTDQKNNYSFTPSIDGLYRFDFSDVTNNGSFRMHVYNSDWEQLAHDYSLRAGGGLSVELKAGNKYYITVSHYSGFCSYALNIGCQKATKTLTENLLLTDSIQFTDQKNVYVFEPVSSDNYTVALSGLTASFSLRITIYNSNWEQLKSDYALRNNSGLSCDFSAGKTYYIVVQNYSGNGSYGLRLY